MSYLILTKKEVFFSKDTNYFTLPNGIIIYWGSTGSCLNPSIPDGGSHHCPKSSLSFSSIADYWGEDILPEIKYTHTLSYNANGGSNAPSSSTVTNTLSTYGMTVSSSVPTRTGYTFAGWNTNSSGTETNYSAGNSVSVGANATVTLYAKWTPITYSITYNGNGNTGGYIDVIDSKTGRELGRSTTSKPYNSTARGSDKGSSKTDNAYYNGYYYDSDTSATVTTSGATVYRIFKQRMNTIAGNIIWEDWNNKNLSRPGNVNLYIKGSDGKTYSYVITGNHSQNTSVNRWPYSYNLPKYDSNGNVIVYTVSQDRAISQEKGLSYQEPLINGYDITNKITNMIINTEDYFQIPVTITWDDENDFYGFRPETATIQLLRNGEVIKTADVSDSYVSMRTQGKWNTSYGNRMKKIIFGLTNRHTNLL